VDSAILPTQVEKETKIKIKNEKNCENDPLNNKLDMKYCLPQV